MTTKEQETQKCPLNLLLIPWNFQPVWFNSAEVKKNCPPQKNIGLKVDPNISGESNKWMVSSGYWRPTEKLTNNCDLLGNKKSHIPVVSWCFDQCCYGHYPMYYNRIPHSTPKYSFTELYLATPAGKIIHFPNDKEQYDSCLENVTSLLHVCRKLS